MIYAFEILEKSFIKSYIYIIKEIIDKCYRYLLIFFAIFIDYATNSLESKNSGRNLVKSNS